MAKKSDKKKTQEKNPKSKATVLKEEKEEKVKRSQHDKNVFEREHSFEWEQGDEALLGYAIEDKIASLNQGIKDADRPSLRNKLKAEKRAYRNLQDKVKAGNYGSVDLYKKLARAGIKVDASNRGKGSVSRYDTIDFKFDQYFLKTRYYGLASPLLIILLTVLIIGIMIIGMVLPAEIKEPIDEIGINITSLYTFKLSATEDLLAPNNGNWPSGTWQEGAAGKQGQIYTSPTGETPDLVRLYGHLGMETVDVTVFDVANGFINWTVSPSYKLDFIEELPFMQTADMYYSRFMLGKDSYMTFGKQADGTYNTNNLMYILAVYGTLIAIVGLLICILCALVSSIVSMFTYTGRRLHFYAWGMLIFSAIAMILPAFLAIPSGVTVGGSFAPYFSFLNDSFMANESAVIMLNIPLILILVVSILVLIAPKFFKNKPIKLPTHVPKGNRPPTAALVDSSRKSDTVETKVITRTRTVTKTYMPSSYSIGKGPGLQHGNKSVKAPKMNVKPPQFGKKK